MKILVVSHYYWPEQFPVTAVCEGLVARGHEVTVLTGLPNYHTGAVDDEYRMGRNRTQTHNGVEIIRVPVIGRGSGAFRLALNYYSFSFAACRKTIFLDGDFDAVYVYQVSPITMVEPAVRYKKRYGAPLLVYCCDLWPESMKALLGDRLPSLVQAYKGISRRLYQAADRLVVQSEAFPQYFQEVLEMPADKISYCPQFATDEGLEGLPRTPHEGTNFLIAGNMGRVQDIPVIIDAVKDMRHQQGFQVHFVGDGSRYEETKSMVGELGLNDRVVLHGRKPKAEMPAFYSMADACILALNGDSWIGTTVPTRLQGYMAAGMPVLAAVGGGARAVIEGSGCGCAVDAGDAKGLAALMDDFIEGAGDFSSCGKKGRAYYERHFTLRSFLDTLESTLFDMIERKAS